MKLTRQDIYQQYLRNIGKARMSSSDGEYADIVASFNTSLGQRYQLVLSRLSDYMSQQPKTASTVASQQYYHYPPGVVNVESVTVTIGTVAYPLELVNSQSQWDILNMYPLTGAIPKFYFPRRDDFGILPIPSDVYTITFNSHLRDRNLMVDDYTTGTVTVTNASTTVTGSLTVFTSAMVGRWFQITDTTVPGQGYWYRVAGYTSSTSITLDNTWQAATASGATYRIGEAPEIPDEGHIILVDGVTADFYKGDRNASEDWVAWNNSFWTGDPQNPARDEKNPNIKSGLIGLVNSYKDRNRSVLVRRGWPNNNLVNKLWATTIS